ncbi:hypothetical protein BUALT_Bualt02G0003400 [Buddleja alternifolia]|uniref:Ninja-family protein n=1 Tax=Buddleja alternifolia TaxID=168488 RepID=A0AAV6Y741_9LAMI|nr:hypothetical protein BUALT_Bualt02G0003400 [Buddleja alternifolia]
MMGVLETAIEDDEFELNLELSIGGSYGKSKNPGKFLAKKRSLFGENDKNNNNGFSRFDFYYARVKDREIREKDVFSPDLSGEKVNNGVNLLPYLGKRRNVSGDLYLDCDLGCGFGEHESGNRAGPVSNGFDLEGCSSDDYDHQSKFQKGESNSDSRSDGSENREANGFSSQSRPSHSNTPEKAKNTNFNETNTTSSTIEKRAAPPSRETSSGASVSRMPFVSTTGTGLKGKTVTGFLYKYTETEVSIMCVCHGSSFSPAEFVEHAGDVDILYPLRHITIVPSAFV